VRGAISSIILGAASSFLTLIPPGKGRRLKDTSHTSVRLTFTIRLYNLHVMSTNDPLSRAFAALADPTRRAILQRLAAGEAGVVELAAASTLTQPAITKHLKVLERAGLIGRARDGQRRPARLQLAGLLPVDDWLRRAHAEWSDRLDRLEVHLAAEPESTTTEEKPDA
jgi:DNA-binding transcriptional ArsR family regulator